jgi:hypothetical protein
MRSVATAPTMPPNTRRIARVRDADTLANFHRIGQR